MKKIFLLSILLLSFYANSQTLTIKNGRGVNRNVNLKITGKGEYKQYVDISTSNAKYSLKEPSSFDLENGQDFFINFHKTSKTIDTNYVSCTYYKNYYSYRDNIFYYSKHNYSKQTYNRSLYSSEWNKTVFSKKIIHTITPEWNMVYIGINYKPIVFSDYYKPHNKDIQFETPFNINKVYVKFAYIGQNAYGNIWSDYINFYEIPNKIQKAQIINFLYSLNDTLTKLHIYDSLLVRNLFIIDSINCRNKFNKDSISYRENFKQDSISYREDFINDSLSYIYRENKENRQIYTEPKKISKMYGEISLNTVLNMPYSIDDDDLYNIMDVTTDFSLCIKLSNTFEICPVYGIKFDNKRYILTDITYNGYTYNDIIDHQTGGNTQYFGGKIRINFGDYSSMDIGILYSNKKTTYYKYDFNSSFSSTYYVYSNNTISENISGIPLMFNIGGKRCKFTTGFVFYKNSMNFSIGLNLKLCNKNSL